MEYKNIVDLHVHTDNSDDGFDPVMLICESADAAGIRALAFTDHCECNRYRRDSFDRAIRQSYFEARKAKSVYSGRMVIVAGMELGQPMQDLDAAQDALNANAYDFVLGSLHNVSGEADFWKVDYQSRDAKALLKRYFDEVYEMVEWGQFDSLAHLTYPLRYIVGVEHIEIDIENYTAQIEKILSLLVKKDKALEINTSGYRQDYGLPIPSLEIVRRFRELGGKYITIGSDAHHYYDVGANIRDGLFLAKEAGFNEIALYQNRSPILLPIQ